jgi:hypothetical protein
MISSRDTYECERFFPKEEVQSNLSFFLERSCESDVIKEENPWRQP